MGHFQGALDLTNSNNSKNSHYSISLTSTFDNLLDPFVVEVVHLQVVIRISHKLLLGPLKVEAKASTNVHLTLLVQCFKNLLAFCVFIKKILFSPL